MSFVLKYASSTYVVPDGDYKVKYGVVCLERAAIHFASYRDAEMFRDEICPEASIVEVA